MKRQLWLVLFLVGFVGCAQFPKNETSSARVPANVEELDIAAAPAPANISYVTLQEKGGQNNAALENCGGHATLKRDSNKLMLLIRDANCGSYSTKNGIERRLDGSGNNGRSIDLLVQEVPGTTQEFTVGSGAFFDKGTGNADRIFVTIPSASTFQKLDTRNVWGETQTIRTPNCHAEVYAKIDNNSKQLNIVVKHSDCSMFDILSNEGVSLRYDAQPLQYSSNIGYNASFTLPKAVYNDNYGYNGVMIRFYSPGRQDDRILVQFNVR